MEPLAPIPTPPAQRWREFRIQALPLLTFIAVLVCVVVLWNNYVVPTAIVGEVESTHAYVISAVPGTIKELKVQRFQRVKAGDEIALVSTMDAETLQAMLRAIEGDLKLMRARMQLDVERNLQSYESFRLDYLNERVDLNLERVRSVKYDEELARQHRLLTSDPPLIDKTTYDYWALLAATAKTNLIEREKYLAEKEKILPTLAPATKADEAILEAIRTQEAALSAEGGMVTLRAPIDGMVTAVAQHAGSKIVENVPIVTISATSSTRIVGYLRRPWYPVPRPGDTVQVRKQSFKREVGQGTVLEVSSQLEPIAFNLIPTTTSGTNELGLPFAISIPPELALLPGEPVDLILNKR